MIIIHNNCVLFHSMFFLLLAIYSIIPFHFQIFFLLCFPIKISKKKYWFSEIEQIFLLLDVPWWARIIQKNNDLVVSQGRLPRNIFMFIQAFYRWKWFLLSRRTLWKMMADWLTHHHHHHLSYCPFTSIETKINNNAQCFSTKIFLDKEKYLKKKLVFFLLLLLCAYILKDTTKLFEQKTNDKWWWW